VENYRIPKLTWQYHPQGKKFWKTSEEGVGSMYPDRAVDGDVSSLTYLATLSENTVLFRSFGLYKPLCVTHRGSGVL
jgi:hypothetical protein